MSNALVIQTLEGARVGFVLTHFETDSTQNGTHQGECIFVTLPASRTNAEHPLTDQMYAHKFAGKHRCVLTIDDDREKYNIQRDDMSPLQILLHQGAGNLIDLEKSTVIGKVLVASAEDEADPSLGLH